MTASPLEPATDHSSKVDDATLRAPATAGPTTAAAFRIVNAEPMLDGAAQEMHCEWVTWASRMAEPPEDSAGYDTRS
jgi:hypothetical protein